MSREKVMEQFDAQAMALWQSDPDSLNAYTSTMRSQLWELLLHDEQQCIALANVGELELQLKLAEYLDLIPEGKSIATPTPQAVPAPNAPIPKQPSAFMQSLKRKAKGCGCFLVVLGVLIGGLFAYIAIERPTWGYDVVDAISETIDNAKAKAEHRETASVSAKSENSTSTRADATPNGKVNVRTGQEFKPVVPKGAGTKANPYQITVLGNLVWMGNNVSESSGEFYKQMNDIDASVTETWNDGEGFAPIGNKVQMEETSFQGNYDGDGKIISGLHINRTASTAFYVGLFGVAINATISNLGMVGGSITAATGDFYASRGAGGLVGYIDSGHSSGITTISNCYATGSVSATKRARDNRRIYAGGLVGGSSQSFGITISNCYATGSVSATSDAYGGIPGDAVHAGGLVGYIECGSTKAVTISNCYATGDISANGKVGGLIGCIVTHASSTSTVSNCYASGSVSATYPVSTASPAHAGGLIGYASRLTISSCYATGSVSALNGGSNGSTDGTRAGGLIGCASRLTISNCYASGGVSASTSSGSRNNAGGLIGYASRLTISNCYASGGVSTSTSSGLAGGLIGEATDATTISSCYATGSVTASDGVSISGGLIGEAGVVEISDCYATGCVSATGNFFGPARTYTAARAGGLVGFAYAPPRSSKGLTIINCYATGSASASATGGRAFASGLVVSSYTEWQNVPLSQRNYTVPLSILNCYWDRQSTGHPNSVHSGEGKTTIEMKTQSTYVGWNFANIWCISADTNNGYPTLISTPHH